MKAEQFNCYQFALMINKTIFVLPLWKNYISRQINRSKKLSQEYITFRKSKKCTQSNQKLGLIICATNTRLMEGKRGTNKSLPGQERIF